MEVYFFKPRTLLGYIICAATFSRYCHTAVKIGDKVYDSSEYRGGFAAWPAKNLDHYDVVGYKVNTIQNMDQWIEDMAGRKYDWEGVLGWFWKADNKKRFYCFEATYSALQYARVVPAGSRPDHLSAKTLMDICKRVGTKID